MFQHSSVIALLKISCLHECLRASNWRVFEKRKEPTSEMDNTAVAVIRISSYSEEVVVGYVPKNMSKIVFVFLSLPHCALVIFATGKHQSWR